MTINRQIIEGAKKRYNKYIKNHFREEVKNINYIKYDFDGNKYGIKVISYNYYQVLKNGLPVAFCDTYEEAQHYIDRHSM